MTQQQRTVRLVKDGVGHYDAPEQAVKFWTARGWRVEKPAQAPKTTTSEKKGGAA